MKLKIMTFNIQHGRNHNYRGDIIDLDSMAQNIREQQPDICGLNEVRKGNNPDHKSGCSDQTAFFAENLGYNSYFANAIIKENYIYGNAILSKTPMLKCEKIMIPDVAERVGSHYESRCIIKSEYEFDGKKLTALNSHFGLGAGEDVNAVDTVLSLLNDIEGPVVLMGDFNKTPDDEQIKRLSSVLTDAHDSVGKAELTFPSNAPEIRIDYIFVRGLKVINAETVKKIVSDHYAITAEIEI
ncbi:MAG: endonuclease/exonuclease/phosphatase family protein [Clostridia bacterium]|nr:endonuclease/exonuclease/phosphatase family protein [Clostridia bacterium]